MDLKTKKTVVSKLAKEYRKATKKQKRLLLNDLIRLAGYNRSYAARVLRKPRKGIKGRQTRRRASKYLSVLPKLKQLWIISNFASGQRFVPMIPTYLGSLKRHGEIKASRDEKELLLKVSSATVDRLFKAERDKLSLKGRSGTKPGTLLKHQIPIKTWADWDNAKPGFLEVDTVHHGGSSAAGEYIHTLDTTDVATGWNECRALMGRSERYTLKALNEIKNRLPFLLLGIDFDSGGEFVNYHLIRYCKRNKITYTRAREGYKNDQGYIEQQNYSVVRRFAGYKRLDTEDQLKILNLMYEKLSDYQNFFQSVMRLKEKIRNGAHVTKRYSKAQSAYQRVLASPDIQDAVKENLKERFLKLNPKSLLREILALAKKL